jgi:hypothetical protein
MSGDHPFGPWEAEHGADGFYLVTHNGGIPLDRDTDAVERLIVAAPEFLDALEKIERAGLGGYLTPELVGDTVSDALASFRGEA